MENQKPNNGKNKTAKPVAVNKAAPPPKNAPIKVPPLFRPIDWIVMGITFVIVWAIYLYTLAPELTLEDSGELCTGSFYAGIPHPPGYPFWAIYSWLWTAILPMGNVAWRVEVGESFGAAWGCAMVAFIVSRGSSMLIEGIEDLKNLSARWEKAICMVSGFVAGMLVGLDGFMWSEADVINRISLFGVPWLILVLLMLMRWMYAPQQRRYLYLAMFFYGICATIHQTLLLSAMGIEVAVALAYPRMGRTFFLGNGMIYMVCLIELAKQSIPALNNMTSVEIALFHIVGIGSILAYIWLVVFTKEGMLELFRDAAFVGIFFFFSTASTTGKFGVLLALCSLGAFIKLTWDTRKNGLEILVAIFCFLLWILGVSFYFYEPIAGMTNPPMEWGYPRTVDGFFHALSRGQYEQANGTDILHDPMRFVHQLGYIAQGLSESFSWVFMFVGLLPFLFFAKMQKRERGWIIGMSAIYFCLAVILVILLNVGTDKSSMDLNKVFFTASHALFAIMIGYGMTLMAAYTATHYNKFRRWGILGASIGILVALYCLADATATLYFGPAGDISLSEIPHWIARAFAKDQYGLPVFANLILVAIPVIFLIALWTYRSRGPVLILLSLFMLMPIYSGLSHWFKSEQRNHWYGYWFGHDMFTPPFGIYPEMTRDAILFGGTDPGRFCPTYMIFCESFIPHKDQPKQDQHFDRRDVYIITQNALADGTYLEYIRAQYFRSSQNALGLDTPFFRDFTSYVLGIPFGHDSSFVHGIASIAYNILDKPFTKFGAKVEARRRAEGVYPPKEIYTPTPEDSQQCFNDYYADVARRMSHDEQFPDEPRQIKPGEDVRVVGDKLQVSGQVAVMEINGLLCKVIFDHNPSNEFFVEESFPLDWMYPYETPFGIIMKINREPVTELTNDVFKKDHEFWSKYSSRLIGNWITYDTSVKDIADFCDKIYLQRNFSGFKGDRKFVADESGQKAFSKLRSSIAGVYAWRLSGQCPPEYRQKNPADMQALIRETDFAFKQSFAFCPYSPEAVFRYVNFLLQFNRLDDAVLVAETCLKFDPHDDSVENLVKQLRSFKNNPQFNATNQSQQLEQLENAPVDANPTNFQNVLNLAGFYLQTRQTNRVNDLFDRVMTDPHIDANELGVIAQFYAQTGNLAKLESVLQKLAALVPDQPEPWYDLASLKAIVGKNSEALKDLKISVDLSNKRLKTNPKARDLAAEARKDQRFNSIRQLPEFQKIVATK